jgi:tryptophan-rich sensory protein
VTDSNKKQIMFLDGSKHEWKEFYEEFGGDSYLEGPEARLNVSAGSYLIKVYNSDNKGKYSLAVGEIESFPIDETLKTLILLPTLKEKFFNKPFYTGFFNLIGLFVFGPIIALTILAVVFYKLYKKFGKKFIKLIVAILICQGAGIIGSVSTMSSIPTWYATINKPNFTPPNWLFGPVWITLFTLMGISLYLIWNEGLRSKKVREALSIFGLQLVLNTLWSILFFGLKNPFYGLIEIIILWITIVITLIKFYNISKTAGLILIPYINWVSIALILNYYVWVLNP